MYERSEPNQTITIFLLETESADALAIQNALSESGIPFDLRWFTEAAGVARALETAERCPDILLSAYELRRSDGLTMCHQLREHCPRTAMIIMARHGDEYLAAAAIKQGINDYIVKDVADEYLTQLPQLLLYCHREQRQFLQAEAARQQQQEQLLKALHQLKSRNADLDSFAQMVAHDLKNPLSALSGLADLLGDSELEMSSEERCHISQAIASCGQKAINIVEELLKLGRPDSVQMTPVATVRLIEDTVERLTVLYTEVEPQIYLPESWPQAIGHGPWVEEVWTNYISNAIKYGGRPCEIWLGGDYQANGMTRFWVRDNGLGLTAAEQRQLFIPYNRLYQGPIEGTGLGLSIVRRIIERLGGQTGVTTGPEGGSEFWFTLPTGILLEETAAKGRPAELALPTPSEQLSPVLPG